MEACELMYCAKEEEVLDICSKQFRKKLDLYGKTHSETKIFDGIISCHEKLSNGEEGRYADIIGS